ncbi:MAG: XdhC family protein [Oscillospiraceae bacterium]|nr:XdhC family protein [Oscillospiraceae bacterium]
MTTLYSQILAQIEAGQPCKLISRYDPAGITRQLENMPEDAPLADGLQFTQSADGLQLAEYFLPNPRLVILGGGHISVPLCQFAAALGFQVWVYDDRPAFANPDRFPTAHTVLCDDFSHMGDRLAIRRNDYIAILTRGHRHDIQCLEALMTGLHPRYVGMVGSKRRIAIVKEQAATQIGVGDPLLDNLYAPIGLPIGSVTPEEIALSIIAEMVQVKRLGPKGDAKKASYEDAVDMNLFRFLAANPPVGIALATIVSTRGSTPREAGAKMAVTATGEIIGSMGGGCTEADVIRRARVLLDQGGYCLMEVDLTDAAEEDGMVCGGVMTVLIEILDKGDMYAV